MVEAVGIDIVTLLSILALAWTFGLAAQRLGYPALMGELVAGIVFGPTLLGVLRPAAELGIFAELGVFLLMVYVGLEVDIHDLFEMGPAALIVSIGGFLVPLGLGYAAGVVLELSVEASVFIGMAMAATSLATKSRILIDLDLLDTRIAGVLLGGALIADVGVLVAFAGVMNFVEVGAVDLIGVALILGKTLGFFVVAIVVGDRLLPPAWRQLENLMERYGFVDKTAAFTVALMISLAFALLAIAVDLHMIIGGFVAGLFLKQADINEEIFDHIYSVTYDLAMGVFAPIFFVTVGFELTLGVFTRDLVVLFVLVVVAFVGKIVGSWLFAIPTELTSREGFVVGLGMNGRGAVEIVIASIGLSAGVIDTRIFSILVFIAVFTTALVPPTMKWGVRWLDRAGELVRFDEPADIPH
jgi:Kef-type K+ transport system membrane component KefB